MLTHPLLKKPSIELETYYRNNLIDVKSIGFIFELKQPSPHNEIRTISITFNKSDENDNLNILFCYKKLSRALLYCLIYNKMNLIIDDENYTITAIKQLLTQEQISEKYKFIIGDERIYVSDKLKRANYTLLAAGSKHPDMLLDFPVCKGKGGYSIRNEAIKSTNGCPLIKNLITQNSKRFIDELSEESLLHMYGYNVNINNGIDAETRQALLSFLIQYDYLSKAKIIDTIRFAIIMHPSEKYETARIKWERDISYLNGISDDFISTTLNYGYSVKRNNDRSNNEIKTNNLNKLTPIQIDYLKKFKSGLCSVTRMPKDIFSDQFIFELEKIKPDIRKYISK